MKIERVTLAATNVQAMVEFYDAVFDARLEPVTAFGTTLYKGHFLGLDLLICPNEIAGVDARQNRHQFRLMVPELTTFVENMKTAGGTIINQNSGAVGFRDPDGNTYEVAQDGSHAP
jgi:catechol 2,3-dioxygenase-like lactoylglutathione lyase family enzyme